MPWSIQKASGRVLAPLALLLWFVVACSSQPSPRPPCRTLDLELSSVRPARIRARRVGALVADWTVEEAADYLNDITKSGPHVIVVGQARDVRIAWALNETQELIEALRSVGRFTVSRRGPEYDVRLASERWACRP